MSLNFFKTTLQGLGLFLQHIMYLFSFLFFTVRA